MNGDCSNNLQSVSEKFKNLGQATSLIPDWAYPPHDNRKPPEVWWLEATRTGHATCSIQLDRFTTLLGLLEDGTVGVVNPSTQIHMGDGSIIPDSSIVAVALHPDSVQSLLSVSPSPSPSPVPLPSTPLSGNIITDTSSAAETEKEGERRETLSGPVGMGGGPPCQMDQTDGSNTSVSVPPGGIDLKKRPKFPSTRRPKLCFHLCRLHGTGVRVSYGGRDLEPPYSTS
eukprot:CAMPEP_0182424666 /NCGR_PEP_ID=MMETSP1167-20130531/10898_1 /TAXON_ID=2988 /ORGANISM="Mallomonas Sp, Strain CCMP3275" /LENGTH=227 /DNA_ID=CAMNT_0024604647 /DNA_START=376 /DNA_END=1055 /DNA_ORIENTATION=+